MAADTQMPTQPQMATDAEPTIALRQLRRYHQRATEVSRLLIGSAIFCGVVAVGLLLALLVFFGLGRGFNIPLAGAAGGFAYIGLYVGGFAFMRRSRIRDIEDEIDELQTRLATRTAQGRRIEESTDTWNVAQGKLEEYWNRNLSQVASIFWISVTVMILGFGVLVFGVVSGFQNSANRDTAFLSVGAGIITEFIGATFMIIFRSTMQQASSYVNTLARIHSIGMAVQVVNEIDDGGIQNQARAAIATTLIGEPDINRGGNER